MARHHLRHERGSGWLCGVACGPTGTGKTLAGRIVCRAFGLDESSAVRLTESETERSLWGRREKVKVGRGHAWVMTPAVVLGYPFLVLDEIDKAPADLRIAVLKLLQGEARVAGEGDDVLSVAPAVLATTNGGPSSLRPEYRRRAVVLDTTPLLPLLRDIDLAARHVLEPGVLPRLDLDKLRPPATKLDDEDRDLLRSLLRAVLTDEAWRETDRVGLELAVLGRLAFMGDSSSLESAVLGTVVDYVSCAATIGQVTDGGLGLLHAAARGDASAGYGGAVGVLTALETAKTERETLEVQRGKAARKVRVERHREDLDLVGARAAMRTRLEDTAKMISHVPPSVRAYAAGIRSQLRRLAEDISASRSAEALSDLVDLAAEPIRKAEELRLILDTERAGEPSPTATPLLSLPSVSQRSLPEAELPDLEPIRDPSLACQYKNCGVSLVGAVPDRRGVVLCCYGHPNRMPGRR